MKTSSFQVLVTTHTDTHNSWLLLIQVQVDGVKRPLAEVVSSLTVISSEKEVETEWVGQCDTFTSLYRVTSSTDLLLTCPVLVTVSPLYHVTTLPMYRLQPGLASLVGRDYLCHPKYAVTCLHSYARTKSLYQPGRKTIWCDERLEAIFGCGSIRLDRVWAEISKQVNRTQPDNIQLSLPLSDLDKEYRSVISLKTDHLNNLYPSFFSPSSRHAAISKSVSHHGSSKLCSSKKRSFKRSKSVDI